MQTLFLKDVYKQCVQKNVLNNNEFEMRMTKNKNVSKHRISVLFDNDAQKQRLCNAHFRNLPLPSVRITLFKTVARWTLYPFKAPFRGGFRVLSQIDQPTPLRLHPEVHLEESSNQALQQPCLPSIQRKQNGLLR